MDVTSIIKTREQDITAVLNEAKAGLGFSSFLKGCQQLFMPVSGVDDTTATKMVLHLAALALNPTPAMQQVYVLKFGATYTISIGYKGYITLYARQGIGINADVVREGDEFRFVSGSEPSVHHIPSVSGEGAIIAAYASALNRDGFRCVALATTADLVKARTRSKATQFWDAGEAAMCKKTAIHQLKHQLPALNSAASEVDSIEADYVFAPVAPNAGTVQGISSLNALYTEYELTSEQIDGIEKQFAGDVAAITAHLNAEYGPDTN